MARISMTQLDPNNHTRGKGKSKVTETEDIQGSGKKTRGEKEIFLPVNWFSGPKKSTLVSLKYIRITLNGRKKLS